MGVPDHAATHLGVVLQVIGVGGGGSNAVNRMLQSDLAGVDFWVVNTDNQVRALAGGLQPWL